MDGSLFFFTFHRANKTIIQKSGPYCLPFSLHKFNKTINLLISLNSFQRTNVQRIVTGEIMDNPAKRTPGQFNVRYSGLPLLNYESTMNVLDTDYKTYAVIWSCSRIGPIGHTDTFWVMTRKRMESGPGMQRAYGVLDKFKVSRTFFIKTDQTSCETLADQEEAIDPTPSSPLSTYGPPAAAEGELDSVLLDGGNETTENKIGTELGPEESLIAVGPEQDVLIEIAENYVPITNNIGYRTQGKDAGAGLELVKDVPEIEVPISPVVEVLKKAAEVGKAQE